MDVAATLLSVLKEYGGLAFVAAALGSALAFFVYRALKREDALQTQIDTLNKELRDIVIPLVTQCKEVILQNSRVIERLIGDPNK